MAIPEAYQYQYQYQYLHENSLSVQKLPKKHKDYPQRPKGMSFFAFVFSIFMYTSIFYVFNISPSSLFDTTKFWFFISNTLILIIAADYGAFSSSKKKKQFDFYEEYVARSSSSNGRHPGSGSGWENVADKGDDVHEECLTPNNNSQQSSARWEIVPCTREMDKITVKDDNVPCIDLGNNLETEEFMDSSTKNESQEKETRNRGVLEVDHHLVQSKEIANIEDGTDIPNRNNVNPSENDQWEIIVRDGDEDHNEGRNDETEAENDEFSAMSDEELNRRVEEFILKLKRQIRQQGVRDFR